VPGGDRTIDGRCDAERPGELAMSKRAVWLLLASVALAACERGGLESSHAEHEHEHEAERATHGGRLLVDGDFQLELAIFESGASPEFRAWASSGPKPVPPSGIELTVELHRLGGAVDRIGFAPQGDFLR